MHPYVNQLCCCAVIQYRRAAQLVRNRLFLCTAIGTGSHHLFVSSLAVQQHATGFIDDECVRRHQTTYHRFAETPGGADHGLVTATGYRVSGEQDASRLSWHQDLHHNRQAQA